MNETGNLAQASPEWRIQQYRAYLADVANIGQRHENTRRFYLSVVSAIFVFLSLAGENGALKSIQGPVRILVGVFGIVLSLGWIAHMQSFGAIYKAKFAVLRAMEEKFEFFDAFEKEWKSLKTDGRYWLLTANDSVLPLVFAALFAALLCLG